jgi:hypothetical protein
LRAKGFFVSRGDGRLLGAEENHRPADHTVFVRPSRDDVLAGGSRLLTSEALASRFVNKQKQNPV